MLLILSILILLILGRIVWVFYYIWTAKKSNEKLKKARTLLVLGSGGHTTEMLEIVKKLNPDKYNPRFYVVAENDENSIRKLKMTEEETPNKNYKVFKIPRSRKVKQSYWSSIFTTLVSLFSCFPLLWEIRPNLILCNGPGTCVPICFVALLFRILFINRHCKIVFVESFCRVKTLSLSGKLLLYASDVFVVQWPRLKNISNKILYFGRLT